MFFTIFLFCLVGVPFIQCKQLHEYMTEDEVRSVFNTPHHLVPEYEIVPVLHRSAKGEDSEGESEIKVDVFQENLELYLHPTEGMLASKNTPVWTATSDSRAPEGVRYKQVPGAMRNLGVAFQDVSKSSAVILSPASNGRVHVDGVLNNTYVIKSLPERILNEVAYGGHKLLEPHHTKNVTDDDDFAYTHHHVVYKIPPLKGDQYKDFKIPHILRTRSKRSAPDIIYPEVLVMIDHRLYDLLGRDMKQAMRYTVGFWNGVDLRYRLLSTPKIIFHIAGVVIARDENAFSFLEKSRYETKMVDSDLALRGVADYLYREDRFGKDFYDMALVMTTLDMCNMFGDSCDPSTLGYAYVAGACDRNATKQSSEAVGIFEDNGGFSGIIPAAHEIGHLIGARHDGNPTHAAECEVHGGFIMTNGLLLHENGFEWSACSIDAFYKFISEDRAKCLYNKPEMGEQVRRVLPGKLMSLDDQCKMVRGTPACNKDETVCTRLECEYPGHPGFCLPIAPAAEGSPCGDDLICLNGKCVLEGVLTKEQEQKLTEEQRKRLPKLKTQKIQKVPWLKHVANRIKDRIGDKIKKIKDIKNNIRENVRNSTNNILDNIRENARNNTNLLDNIRKNVRNNTNILDNVRNNMKDKIRILGIGL